jgi:UDP-glucose 4-epimerase
MKVLITGGAGFIGANLVRKLETMAGIAEIVVIDDLSFGFRENLDGTSATLLEGSILDEELLRHATDGASTIVHLAARSSVPRSVAEPMATHEVNATGTALVLEAARQTGDVQVIVASSSSVYGSTDVLPKHEELATRPISPYAASKLATESYALAWGHSYGLPVLALRLFNVFGPLQPPAHTYAAVIPAFLAAACSDRSLPVHGDGTQCRDFTFVGSVVDVLGQAITRRVSHPDPVNLAFGTRVTLLEVVAKLEHILERRLPVDHMPTRVGDVRRSQADSSLLLELFPDLEPTELADGLRATVEWFKRARPWEHPASV